VRYIPGRIYPNPFDYCLARRGIKPIDFIRLMTIGSEAENFQPTPDRLAMIEALPVLREIRDTLNTMDPRLVDEAISNLNALSVSLINKLDNGHNR